MKTRKGNILFGLTITCIGSLTLFLTDNVMQDQIVIRFGVRAFSLIRSISKGTTIGGIILTALLSIPIIYNWKRQRQQQRQEQTHRKNQVQIRTKYAEDSTNPDLTRKRLLQAQAEMPMFKDLFDRCLKQLDRMDALQLKQNRLILDNDASYLNETENVLNKVEGRICQNFRNIINLCTIADNAEQLDVAKVEKVLDGNEEKLKAARSLLKASAEWVNKYNADNDSDRSEVQKWILVINNYLKEE